MGGIKVESIQKLTGIIKEKGIRIAILAVSALSAQKVSEQLIECGIKAILNFSPVNLALPEKIHVTNVDVASELESLVYKLKRPV